MVDLCGRAFAVETGGPSMRSTKLPREKVRGDTRLGVSPSTLARRVRALSLDPSRFEVRHGPAESLGPIPGSVAYLDPPYAATASYRAVSLLPPRTLAERWARAGCRVGLSEMLPAQAPLGWPCHDLSAEGKGASRHKTLTAGRRELLFVSP